MDPATIAALIGAATSAIQGITGGFQLNKARQLERQYPRPTATVAKSIQDLQGYAYSRALDQDIPGGDIYRDEIRGATSAGLSAASKLGSGAEAYGALDRLVLGQQKNFAQMAAKAAEQRYAAQGTYMDVLKGPVYEEERRVDYWNKEMPYLQAAQAALNLKNSGSQNIMAGVKNIAGSVSGLLSPTSSTTKKEYDAETVQAIIEGIMNR